MNIRALVHVQDQPIYPPGYYERARCPAPSRPHVSDKLEKVGLILVSVGHDGGTY